MEDAGQIIDARVVGTFLVPLIESLELRDENPRRQRDEEEQRLRARGDRIRGDGIGCEQGLSDEERPDEPEEVGSGERPAYEPASAPCGTSGRLRWSLERGRPLMTRRDQASSLRFRSRLVAWGFGRCE